ncbi:MAG: Gfo/Idh/MocA family protein [Verrucomicrobiales bacterium]
MNPTRAGVIGTGGIGRNHARVYAGLPGVTLAAVFDTDTARAGEIAGPLGAPVAATLEEFISMVDVASVAVPTIAHREVAGRLLEAGKHVLVEKPIADNRDDALALVELARERSLVLQVGHIERYNPVLRELEAKLGTPRFIEASRLSPFPGRSTDIGVVLDLMIHDLEIILHLVRSPVASVDAVGVPVLTTREDIANARLRFENGCVANITASRISTDRLRKIRVFQEDTYLSLDYMDQSGYLMRKGPGGLLREEVEIEKREPLAVELAEFVACAREGRRPRVSGQEGAAALDLAIEITRLVEQGRKP